jgi:hypothetical protein
MFALRSLWRSSRNHIPNHEAVAGAVQAVIQSPASLQDYTQNESKALLQSEAAAVPPTKFDTQHPQHQSW